MKVVVHFFTLLSFSMLLLGCRPNAGPAASQTPVSYHYVDSDATSTSHGGFDPSMTGPQNDGNPTTAQLESAQNKAIKALKAHPNDLTAKKDYVVASDRLAMGLMVDPKIDRKIKYKKALEIYKQVLKVDPKNQEAASNSALIIRIYKELGKPVPN